MPLTPEQQQEMQEMEELDQLHQKYGATAPAPSDAKSFFNPLPGMTPDQADTEQKKAISSGQVVAGTPPLAIPAGGLPKAVSAIANLVNKNAVTRTMGGAAVGGAQGAIGNPQDRLSGFLKGAGMGAATNVGAEALGAGLGAVKGAYRAVKPAGAQANMETLDTMLGKGQTVRTNPENYEGFSKEADQIIGEAKPPMEAQQAFEKESLGKPGSFDMPADKFNKMRQALDKPLSWPNPTDAERAQAGAANQARGALHDLGAEENQTFGDISSEIKGQQAMRKAQRQFNEGDVMIGGEKMLAIPAQQATRGAGRRLSQPAVTPGLGAALTSRKKEDTWK